MAIIVSDNQSQHTPGVEPSVNSAYVWMISLVAALGGLLFGYDWVVIGGAAKFYVAFFHLTDTAATVAADATFWQKLVASAVSPVGWAQSCALLGCLMGRWCPARSATASAASRSSSPPPRISCGPRWASPLPGRSRPLCCGAFSVV